MKNKLNGLIKRNRKLAEKLRESHPEIGWMYCLGWTIKKITNWMELKETHGKACDSYNPREEFSDNSLKKIIGIVIYGENDYFGLGCFKGQLREETYKEIQIKRRKKRPAIIKAPLIDRKNFSKKGLESQGKIPFIKKEDLREGDQRLSEEERLYQLSINPIFQYQNRKHKNKPNLAKIEKILFREYYWERHGTSREANSLYRKLKEYKNKLNKY